MKYSTERLVEIQLQIAAADTPEKLIACQQLIDTAYPDDWEEERTVHLLQLDIENQSLKVIGFSPLLQRLNVSREGAVEQR